MSNKYNMRGMGGLLTLYGGASEEIEAEYQKKREAFIKCKKEYLQCTDSSKKKELKKLMTDGHDDLVTKDERSIVKY
jgi:hypothetical protein